ncbi:MAG: hypothetical protein ACE5KE_10175 [Methanosarcinales archaeon]
MEKEELIKKWEKEDEEYRKIRMEHANWEYIEKQKPRIKSALKYYAKTGNLRLSAKIAGVTVDEMNELRKKADIPLVV